MKLQFVLWGGFLTQAALAFSTSRPGSFQRVGVIGRTLASTQTLRSTAATTIDVSENAQRDVYGMQEYMAQCGVQTAEGFQLGSEDGLDWSAFTNMDLPASSPVVFVPNGVLLSSWQAADEFGSALQEAENQLVQADIGDRVTLFRLFVKILAEYERGDQSPWFPWLNSLPRLFNNGAAMTYACFECLPPYIAWLAMRERKNSVNFQKAVKFVQYAGGISEATASNTDLLKWAYNVAATRSYDFNGERVIAPMADMFNHGTETEVAYQFDEGGNFMVYTTTDVPAGSPLRISLGDPTNPSPLFATYGFLDETSPATFCKLMKLQKEMEDLGLSFSNLLFYKDTGDISPEVWDVLLYSILAQDQSVQQGFYQAYMNGDEDTKAAYHGQYFPYTLEALKKHVDDTLRELDKLSATARTRDPNRYPRAPLILRHNEFVKETFLKVKQNIDAM